MRFFEKDGVEFFEMVTSRGEAERATILCAPAEDSHREQYPRAYKKFLAEKETPSVKEVPVVKEKPKEKPKAKSKAKTKKKSIFGRKKKDEE